MTSTVSDVRDALEAIAASLQSRDVYDWIGLAVTILSATGTLAAVVIALRSANRADRSAEQSVAVAKEAASAASESAKVSAELLRIEQVRLDEKYRDDLRRPLTALWAGYRDFWERHEDQYSYGPGEYAVWAKHKDRQLVDMSKSIDELLLITRGNDDARAVFAMRGLIGAIRKTRTANAASKLTLGMDVLTVWSIGSIKADLAAEKINELTHDAQEDIHRDAHGRVVEQD